MKIRTQFLISLVIFAVMLAVIGFSLFVTSTELDRASKQGNIANDIAQGATELGYLANDYILNGEPQQQTRWQTRFNELTNSLGQLDISNPATASLVDDIKTNQKSLQTVFNDVSASITTNPVSDPALRLAFIQVSWSRLQVPTQAIVFDAARLPMVFEDRSSQVHLNQLFLLVAFIILMVMYFIVNYFLVNRRTLRSVAEIQAGARFIGAGNLDYVLPIKYDDEISDLSRSFNKMAANLKTITASRSDLEKEMIKRIEAEEELHITNEELRIANENLQENAKKLEQTFSERSASEERFRGVFQNAPYAAALSTIPDSRYTDVNEAFANLTGYTKEELIGKTSAELGIFRDAGRRATIVNELRAKGSAEYEEAVIHTKSGEQRIVSSDFEKMTFGGQDYFLNMSIDITARKKMEEEIAGANQRIKEILESIADDFYVLDRNWKFVYANRQYASKIDKEPADFIGRNYWQMFPKNIGTLLEDNYRAAMEHRVTRRFEWTSSYVNIVWRVSVFPSAEGITVIGEDITEIMKTKESLGKSYEELERINRVAVGRELRMIELKKEINRYYIATGQSPRYLLDLDEDK